MDWRQGYHDTCIELHVLQIRERGLIAQLELAHKTVFSGEMPSDSHHCHIPLDKALISYDDVASRLNEVREVISQLAESKKQMEQMIEQFEGLERKVVVMRDIHRKSLYQIADELGYSYDWVKKISRRAKGIKFRTDRKKGTMRQRIS